ncbi:MAG: hypothetical protein IT383_01045 [Deltaproteobacteria bacterium]|nr:hypothetical protein [Deltaproteobacteria bacterium]
MDPVRPTLPTPCAALACAVAAALATGCLGHARPVELDVPTLAPPAATGGMPIEIREGDVELVVQGEPLDAAATDATRAHVARVLLRVVGTPAQGAGSARTRLTLTTPRPALFVTGPYRRYTFALETELPGGRVVHTSALTVVADDDDLFALEQWAGIAAATQGALALGLAGLGLVFADNDPNEAAAWLTFSALPTASGALVTAVMAAALGGHARAHASRRASDALVQALVEHAADVRGELERRGDVPAAPPAARGASAVSLVLHDELSCLSQVDLERDLEAMVPASTSARFTLDASVRPGPRDEVVVRLVVTRVGAAAPLAERELSVARGDCGTLARAVARIARMQIEASTMSPALGGAP